jgi:hypothetical protein
MKTNLLIVSAFLSLISWQCSPDSSSTPSKVEEIDYDQASSQLMKNLAPHVVGQWTLRQVQVKYQNEYGHNQIKLTRDTTFQNLATLTIVPAVIPRTSPVDPRRGEYDGTISYKNKTYPIQLNMRANPEWIYSKKGPQTLFLFEYHFPSGSHLTEPEEAFLQNIGLVGDNFSLETTIGQPTMIWRGYNRGIERIDFVRQ